MKKLWVVSLLIILLLSCSANALAAVYAQGDSNSQVDSWYSVIAKQPYLEAYYDTVDSNPSYTEYGLEFFKNDQTFLDYDLTNTSPKLTYFAGSYLFRSGFFLGYGRLETEGMSAANLSPGIRFGSNDQRYVAISFDNSMVTLGKHSESDIVDFDFSFKYLDEGNYKIDGQVLIPYQNERNSTTFNVNANFRTDEQMVIGGSFAGDGYENTYSAGLTFTPAELIIDAKLGKERTSATAYIYDTYYALSGMVKLAGSFKLGAEYIRYDDAKDGKITAKAAYGSKKAKFVLKHSLKNDSYDSTATVAFNLTL